MKIIRVSHYQVRSVGHGGFHRTYQLQHDLERIVGPENVVRFDDPWAYYPATPFGRLSRLIQMGKKKIIAGWENPLKLLAHTEFTGKLFSFPKLLADYKELVRQIEKPAVCLMEHPGFSDLLPINAHLEIPTIICLQNLEALDLSQFHPLHRWGMYTKMIDWANEFNVLAQCAERLCISKVETGLISGLGLSAYYYPYLPVGAIRERLIQIRQERLKTQIEPELFLMVGTVGHDSTRRSFEWFIQNAQTRGLPRGVKVVVVGIDTDKLLPPGVCVPGLELRGWVEQEDLDRLLTSAKAVLIPQLSGFGTLTRLSELSCAGIPTVVSRHATYALDPPPGLEIVDEDWQVWHAAMVKFANSQPRALVEDYEAWEAQQPNSLQTVVQKLSKEL
jgi:glycosyltransferase involved in cell wall biosynthesis